MCLSVRASVRSSADQPEAASAAGPSANPAKLGGPLLAIESSASCDYRLARICLTKSATRQVKAVVRVIVQSECLLLRPPSSLNVDDKEAERAKFQRRERRIVDKDEDEWQRAIVFVTHHHHHHERCLRQAQQRAWGRQSNKWATGSLSCHIFYLLRIRRPVYTISSLI